VVTTTTTAAALAAGSSLGAFSGADCPEALFVLSALAGVMMIAAGVLRWGRFTRFVSVSVLTEFLTGVAANIILGQLGDLLGSPQKGSPALVKAWNVITHPGDMSLTAVAVGVSALVLMVVLSRTRIASVASLVALAVPTLLTLGASELIRVQDSGRIPSGFPRPHIPHLSLLSSLDLITGAAAIAVIVLVQGTGVAEAAPNPGGAPSDPNRDFIAQGIGNVTSGLFRGQPVGGSVSQTALNVAAGARSRWASIVLRAVDAADPRAVLRDRRKDPDPDACRRVDLRRGQLPATREDRHGPAHRAAVADRVRLGGRRDDLPVTAAVGIGVGLSLVLQVNQEAIDLTVVRLERGENGRLIEAPAPGTLASREVTVLDVYGSLLFAGARTLQNRLPTPTGSELPVVVLRLRGRTTLGATAFIVLADYPERLS
jgi:sulfate permease, SulP family